MPAERKATTETSTATSLPSAISALLRFPAGEEEREAIRRLDPAIPEEARAVIKRHLKTGFEWRMNP